MPRCDVTDFPILNVQPSLTVAFHGEKLIFVHRPSFASSAESNTTAARTG